MDLSVIEMERPKARQAFLDYRRAVRQRHDEEDEQIMRGYRELARGRQLIHLSETIRAGGVVPVEGRNGWGTEARASLPALAVMRADRTECWFQGRTSDGETVFLPARGYRGRRDRVVVSGVEGLDGSLNMGWRALVPKVPPALRPNIHLRNFHILWEADWDLGPPAAPGDPALLRRIGGDLFAVVAIWELTDLERAVLGARRGS